MREDRKNNRYFLYGKNNRYSVDALHFWYRVQSTAKAAAT